MRRPICSNMSKIGLCILRILARTGAAMVVSATIPSSLRPVASRSEISSSLDGRIVTCVFLGGCANVHVPYSGIQARRRLCFCKSVIFQRLVATT